MSIIDDLFNDHVEEIIPIKPVVMSSEDPLDKKFSNLFLWDMYFQHSCLNDNRRDIKELEDLGLEETSWDEI